MSASLVPNPPAVKWRNDFPLGEWFAATPQEVYPLFESIDNFLIFDCSQIRSLLVSRDEFSGWYRAVTSRRPTGEGSFIWKQERSGSKRWQLYIAFGEWAAPLKAFRAVRIESKQEEGAR